MRKAIAVLFVAGALAVVGSSVALGDVVTGTRSASTFVSNDSLNWGLLGVNNFFVAQGSTLNSTTNGVMTTVNFGHTASNTTGATFVQCPVGGCSWIGNFAPGDVLLSDINFNTGGNSGWIGLSFATGISAIGFQVDPNFANVTFSTAIAAYDGSTLLGIFYFPFGFAQDHGENNSAGFYGVIDSTGADITSIKVLAYNCGAVGLNLCGGFSINDARLLDPPASPEPASLALLGSGLGMLGLLRRKLAARK